MAIFLICGYLIAKATSRTFVHGVLLGLANSVWVTVAHVVFFNQYVVAHSAEAQMMQRMPGAPRLMMALTGPVVGVVSGVVIGAIAWLESRFVKPARA